MAHHSLRGGEARGCEQVAPHQLLYYDYTTTLTTYYTYYIYYTLTILLLVYYSLLHDCTTTPTRRPGCSSWLKLGATPTTILRLYYYTCDTTSSLPLYYHIRPSVSAQPVESDATLSSPLSTAKQLQYCTHLLAVGQLV